MKISAIIPMYNSNKTIKSTIDSVLNQTYKEPIEIIVVNDGSTDGCEKIVEEMILNNQTNRIIKLINKPNGGVSSARNIGIKKANGEFIAFLDSDDIWHPQKLEICLKTMGRYAINFLGHNYTLKDNTKIIYDFGTYKLKKIKTIEIFLRNFAVTPSIVIKRDFIEFFNEDMNYNEDHELWLRLSFKTDIYFLDVPLVMIGRPLLTKGGLSGDKWKMRKGELQMYRNIIKYHKKLIIFYPLLIIFSLGKHLCKMIEQFYFKLRR